MFCSDCLYYHNTLQRVLNCTATRSLQSPCSAYWRSVPLEEQVSFFFYDLQHTIVRDLAAPATWMSYVQTAGGCSERISRL
jgi:hypothetical protein